MRINRLATIIAPFVVLAIFVSGAGAGASINDVASQTRRSFSFARAASLPLPSPRVSSVVEATNANPDIRTGVPPATPAACAGCHASIAREWQASGHARSASDSAYQEAVEHEPLPFCRSCHAPRANALLPTPGPLRDQGIGCTDCHVGFTQDHATTTAAANARASASASANANANANANAKPCASCHEFAFPSGIGGLMQQTAREHRSSAFADVSCASCHMKRVGEESRPHKDHRFNIAPLLADAIAVDVTRASDTSVAIWLRPKTIGHAFPTGDLFRRLRVRAELASNPAVAYAERYLSRHFRSQQIDANGQHARIDDRDDRVGMPDQPECF